MNLLLLKIIGIITMTIDHSGAILFSDSTIFRIIGRIAFPIFAFLISQSCKFTTNKKRFVLVLLISSIVCDPIYNLAFYNSLVFRFNNIFYTLLLGSLSIFVIDKDIKIDLKMGLLLIIFILSFIVDYGIIGVLSIFLYNKFSNTKKQLLLISIFNCFLYIIFPFSYLKIPVLFSIPILLSYNYKKGYNNKYKYLFYIYYPVHLILLYVLKTI